MNILLIGLLAIATMTTVLNVPVVSALTNGPFSNFTNSHTPLITAGLHPKVMEMAVKAYNWAKSHGKTTSDIMTIVDFSKPSNTKRLWVVNLASNTVLYHGYVSQGKNSGNVLPTSFSNQIGSKKSSLGLYKTTYAFNGKHGRSLKLAGLEKGINNNAAARNIEIHPAAYASKEFVKAHGRAGLSWGCFALGPKFAQKVISVIKDDTLLFAYAPQLQNDPNYGSGSGNYV